MQSVITAERCIVECDSRRLGVEKHDKVLTDCIKTGVILQAHDNQAGDLVRSAVEEGEVALNSVRGFKAEEFGAFADLQELIEDG